MITVLVAEDVRLLREALVSLLRQEDGIEVVASIGSGDQIVPAALHHRPGVAVIDITMPGRDGLDAAAELRRRLPQCRILILTGSGQPAVLRRSVQAGVQGFMLKDTEPGALVDAIRSIAAGNRVIDPDVAYTAIGAVDSPLTERETMVLRRTAAGSSPREVAASMHLSYGTVRNYLASAVTKLGARNRVDAIRIATEAGWL